MAVEEIRQRLVHVVPLIHIALGHIGGGEFAARELLVRLSRDVEGVGDADFASHPSGTV